SRMSESASFARAMRGIAFAPRTRFGVEWPRRARSGDAHHRSSNGGATVAARVRRAGRRPSAFPRAADPRCKLGASAKATAKIITQRHESVMEGKSPADVARLVLKHGAWATAELVRSGRPRHVVHFYGRSLGDDLMCTAVLREMRRRGYRSVWMMSRFPELFAHNTDVDRVVPHDQRYDRYVHWMGGRSWYIHYGGHDQERDQSPIPEQHIIARMCASCELTGEITLRPYLHLTDAERAVGLLGPRQIALHSSGLSAYSAMQNKEWGAGRMQQVVHALRDEFTFVQLGAPSDPKLDGCIDLRGRTTLRHTA